MFYEIYINIMGFITKSKLDDLLRKEDPHNNMQ